MGLNFFLGLIIYLLILLTLMVWFLKYHGNNDGNHPQSTSKNLAADQKDEAGSAPTKPNQISTEFKQSGGQSVSEKKRGVAGIL